MRRLIRVGPLFALGVLVVVSCDGGGAPPPTIVTDGGAVLHWVRAEDGVILDKATVLQDKGVKMTADLLDADSGPTLFSVFEVEGNFIAGFKEFVGLEGSDTPVDFFAATEVRPGRFESDVWAAGVPGPDNQAEYYFEDDLGNRSAVMYVTKESFSIITEQIEVEGGVKVPCAGGRVPVTCRVEGEWSRQRITYVVEGITDPSVRLSVLLPWDEEGSKNLRSYLIEYLRRLAPEIDPEEFLVEYSEFLPTIQPEGWSFTLSEDKIEIESGESAAFSLTIEAPSPARAAFAIRVVDLDEPERFVVTNILELVAGE